MNPKVIIAVVVVLALLAAGYVWYVNQPTPLPPQVAERERDTTPAPSAAQISVSIEGAWRSVDDPQFTRSFENGVVTDRYGTDASATVTGQYELNGDTVPAQVREGAGASPVLSIAFPEEALFFIVTKLTARELELMYVGGNGALRFSRI